MLLVANLLEILLSLTDLFSLLLLIGFLNKGLVAACFLSFTIILSQHCQIYIMYLDYVIVNLSVGLHRFSFRLVMLFDTAQNSKLYLPLFSKYNDYSLCPGNPRCPGLPYVRTKLNIYILNFHVTIINITLNNHLNTKC